MEDSQRIFEAINITKKFPGVIALNQINISLFAGKVYALIGENGAGKSTFVKIMGGAYHPTSGQLFIEENEVTNLNPKKAQDLGIAHIHQELNLIPELSAAENIFLGRERKGILSPINWKSLFNETIKYTNKLGIEINPKVKISSLPLAYQKIVEIAKALSLDAKIIIMDEPTDVLTDNETTILFDVIRKLRKEGKTVVYISHRLEEINDICDEFFVLRDGSLVGSGKVCDYSKQQIIDMMVGRKISEQYPRIEMELGKEILRVEALSKKGGITEINFSINEGEILGFYGLIGAGQSDVAKCIFGDDTKHSGKIFINSIEETIKSPKDAVEKGIFLLTNDRKKNGIIPEMSVKSNITISSLKQLNSKFGNLDRKKEYSITTEYVRKFGIKTPSNNQPMKMLSGGNQQKALVARGVITKPKIFILDEPTRGIDVGSKVSIYEIINQLKKNNVAIMIISSEIPEILGICDRIVVMFNGKITGEFQQKDATEKKLLSCAFGDKWS
ncbi:MAG: sugar ABC transporter ATP-binding protein [Flexilinea sp.]